MTFEEKNKKMLEHLNKIYLEMDFLNEENDKKDALINRYEDSINIGK